MKTSGAMRREIAESYVDRNNQCHAWA